MKFTVGKMSIGLIVLGLNTILYGSVIDLRPIDDTFVLNPGTGNAMHSTSSDRNFGGSGSLCVAGADAYAYSSEEGILDFPKGLFESVLKFDTSSLAGKQVSEVALKLYISNGNRSAKNIFNYLGHEGNFNVYLVNEYWENGYGTSNLISGDGLTYDSLHGNILTDSNSELLDTLYYDAVNGYGEPQWYEFSLSLENESFLSAIEAGEEISLYLSPEDSDMCFNFSAYIQQSSEPDMDTYRDNGAYLSVLVPEPSILLMLAVSGFGCLRNRSSSRAKN